MSSKMTYTFEQDKTVLDSRVAATVVVHGNLAVDEPLDGGVALHLELAGQVALNGSIALHDRGPSY